VGSKTYSPNQVGTGYSWVKVAAAIYPVSDHYIQFQAAFTAQFGPATLSTDWFVDEVAMVPVGSPPPT
jgi:hypothetical protein